MAFKAELDQRFDFDECLFSGARAAVATHYRASTHRFDGNDSRPSTNDHGNIAVDESERLDNGVFVSARAGFRTISPPDPEGRSGRAGAEQRRRRRVRAVLHRRDRRLRY